MGADNGGSAFPDPQGIEAADGSFVPSAAPGMSLRDYFAAKAMHAFYTRDYTWESTGTPSGDETKARFAEMAADAYLLADAMLIARQS